jgi:glutamate formiminotransferase/formiminotetrahydrofolate cyclodeaminase
MKVIEMTDDAEDQMSLDGFLTNLSSDKPTPGGGSVAALAGALGASLIVMVAKITLKKKDIEPDLKKELEEIIISAEAADTRFKALIDEDAGAYDAVLNAYRKPKETEPEKQARSAAIQAAFIHAADVPMETMELAEKLLLNVRCIAEKGNVNAITDTAVAISMLGSAVRGSRLNVEVNLKYITNDNYKNEMTAKLKKLQKEADEMISDANAIIFDRFQ